jgi:HSP20 family molecular chaperone IbpA
MTEIDEAIGQVSHLYHALTGQQIPVTEVPYAPIPAEKDPVAHVQEQMDRLVGILAGPQAAAAMTPWAPPVTMYEGTNEVVVCVDVPGTSRDRIQLSVQGAVLIISGHRVPSPADGHRVRHVEPRYGTFRRTLPLPPGLRTQDMSASLREGVLEVRIPRDVASSAPRHVAVS